MPIRTIIRQAALRHRGRMTLAAHRTRGWSYFALAVFVIATAACGQRTEDWFYIANFEGKTSEMYLRRLPDHQAQYRMGVVTDGRFTGEGALVQINCEKHALRYVRVQDWEDGKMTHDVRAQDDSTWRAAAGTEAGKALHGAVCYGSFVPGPPRPWRRVAYISELNYLDVYPPMTGGGKVLYRIGFGETANFTGRSVSADVNCSKRMIRKFGEQTFNDGVQSAYKRLKDEPWTPVQDDKIASLALDVACR